MAREPQIVIATDDQVSALLDRYRCPIPFHQVRTRFLGSLAAPEGRGSPIKLIGDLWGGQLPAFDSIDAANELLGALIMGLWNRLTRHEERRAPFRLIRLDVVATRDGLARLALVRRQELEGFIDGLFGSDEKIDLPESASDALDYVGKMRALFAATADTAADMSRPGTPKDLDTTFRLMRELTRDAETEIHNVVVSCARARRQMLAGGTSGEPTPQ